MPFRSLCRQLVLALCLAALALPAEAAACYGHKEMHAEQLLRLHSELMVITAICRNGSAGQPLPQAYGSFTKTHIGVLHDAEQTLIDYYGATLKGNSTRHLDTLRTRLANEYGQKAATMTSPRFCAAFRDKVVHYRAASAEEVENEARLLESAGKAYAPLCEEGRLAFKKSR